MANYPSTRDTAWGTSSRGLSLPRSRVGAAADIASSIDLQHVTIVYSPAEMAAMAAAAATTSSHPKLQPKQQVATRVIDDDVHERHVSVAGFYPEHKERHGVAGVNSKPTSMLQLASSAPAGRSDDDAGGRNSNSSGETNEKRHDADGVAGGHLHHPSFASGYKQPLAKKGSHKQQAAVDPLFSSALTAALDAVAALGRSKTTVDAAWQTRTGDRRRARQHVHGGDSSAASSVTGGGVDEDGVSAYTDRFEASYMHRPTVTGRGQATSPPPPPPPPLSCDSTTSSLAARRGMLMSPYHVRQVSMSLEKGHHDGCSRGAGAAAANHADQDQDEDEPRVYGLGLRSRHGSVAGSLPVSRAASPREDRYQHHDQNDHQDVPETSSSPLITTAPMSIQRFGADADLMGDSDGDDGEDDDTDSVPPPPPPAES